MEIEYVVMETEGKLEQVHKRRESGGREGKEREMQGGATNARAI